MVKMYKYYCSMVLYRSGIIALCALALTLCVMSVYDKSAFAKPINASNLFNAKKALADEQWVQDLAFLEGEGIEYLSQNELKFMPSEDQKSISSEDLKFLPSDKSDKSQPKPLNKPVAQNLKSSIIDFNDVDIRVFIQFIGGITGKNFIIDSRVKGKVTVNARDNISVEGIYEIFESVIAMNGYTAVPMGKVVKIVPQENSLTDRDVRVYYLEHAMAEHVEKILKAKANSKEPTGKSSYHVFRGRLDITTDKVNNSLIISAKDKDYAIVEKIIKGVDIPIPQVYIEAVLMEVNTADEFKVGTEWIFGGNKKNDKYDVNAGAGFTGGLLGGGSGQGAYSSGGVNYKQPSGFSMGLFTQAININGVDFANLGAVVHAYQQDNDVNIISTPQIMASNDKEATIVVGRTVPFKTQSTTTDNDTFDSFEYRDVGMILKIKPHITRKGLVKLNIVQEMTALEETLDFRPTTLKRFVDTTVTVRDKDTIVIAGLIDENTFSDNLKVPCLGDIPLLRYVFGKISKRKNKTNLYIFVSPRIVRSLV